MTRYRTSELKDGSTEFAPSEKKKENLLTIQINWG
jgi:hypothetical protein